VVKPAANKAITKASPIKVRVILRILFFPPLAELKRFAFFKAPLRVEIRFLTPVSTRVKGFVFRRAVYFHPSKTKSRFMSSNRQNTKENLPSVKIFSGIVFFRFRGALFSRGKPNFHRFSSLEILIIRELSPRRHIRRRVCKSETCRSNLNFCDSLSAFRKFGTGQNNIVDANKVLLSVNIGGEENFFAFFYLIRSTT
jgi:hypothetical protein